MSDNLGLFHYAFDQERVLLLAFVTLSLVTVLELWEISFKVILEDTNLLSPLFSLLNNLVLEKTAPLINEANQLLLCFTPSLNTISFS